MKALAIAFSLAILVSLTACGGGGGGGGAIPAATPDEVLPEATWQSVENPASWDEMKWQ